MENISNEIKKAYSNLISLKENLPTNTELEEEYVTLYNKEIDRLLTLGFNEVKEYKITGDKLHPIWVSGNYATGESVYSKEKYITRNILLFNIDAILKYFEVASAETTIGFNLN